MRAGIILPLWWFAFSASIRSSNCLFTQQLITVRKWALLAGDPLHLLTHTILLLCLLQRQPHSWFSSTKRLKNRQASSQWKLAISVLWNIKFYERGKKALWSLRDTSETQQNPAKPAWTWHSLKIREMQSDRTDGCEESRGELTW